MVRIQTHDVRRPREVLAWAKTARCPSIGKHLYLAPCLSLSLCIYIYIYIYIYMVHLLLGGDFLRRQACHHRGTSPTLCCNAPNRVVSPDEHSASVQALARGPACGGPAFVHGPAHARSQPIFAIRMDPFSARQPTSPSHTCGIPLNASRVVHVAMHCSEVRASRRNRLIVACVLCGSSSWLAEYMPGYCQRKHVFVWRMTPGARRNPRTRANSRHAISAPKQAGSRLVAHLDITLAAAPPPRS